MKTLRFFYFFVFLTLFCQIVNAQNNSESKLGLPGDNLNLYAVLKLFQESETLEGFEKNLNLEETKINNLDLNGDNQIDYIKVIDYPDGDNHTIVMQVPVSATENQDVAVFTVQKSSNGEVQIQLIGDEALYGKDYIIEPNYDDYSTVKNTPNPGYTQKQQSNTKTVVIKTTTYVEVAAWPLVRFIYLPSYVVWHSPWYWGYYPTFWRPWRPYYWHYYYGYHSNFHHWYHGYYRHCNHYRYNNWHTYYYSNRRVQSRYYNTRRINGEFANTYSRPDLRSEGVAEYNKRNPANRSINEQRNRSNHNPVNRSSGTVTNRSGSIQHDNRGVSRNNANHEKVVNSERNRSSNVNPRSPSTSERKSSSVKPANRGQSQVRPMEKRQPSVSPRSSGKSPSPSRSSGTSGRSISNSGRR